MTGQDIHIGTAAWGIPRAHAQAFPAEGSGLERYASVLGAVEINTTFYRRHMPGTFARWHHAVPAGFRFSVKMPRAITHDARLASPRKLLAEFFEDVQPLAEKLGVVLIQLPGSLALEPRRAGAFFRAVRDMHEGPVALEPRHSSWYTAEAEDLLLRNRISRVIADPPRPPAAAAHGGEPGLVYFRLHGSPRTYFSEYGDGRVKEISTRVKAASRAAEVWCVFDNTASGAAAGDALRLVRSVKES